MPRALIVGAGIGGAAAGLALRRLGWRTCVFERAAAPRELGFALHLAPNAVAAMRALGIADAVIAGGHVARRVEIRDGHGHVLRRLDARLTGGATPSVIAMRPVVHGALLEALGDDGLRLSSEAVSFAQDDAGVTLRLADGGGETGDILVGADGVASVIRRHLHPGEPPARPSSYCALRGVVHDVDAILRDLSGVLYLAPRLESAVIRAGARSAYWYMSMTAEDVPDGRDARTVLNTFAPRLDVTFQRVAAATLDHDLRFDELLVREPLARWGAGRVTLLGDAAHPMLPHTGQGAAQAMEDAVALGLALRPAGDLPAALRRYEAVRAARTTPLVRMGGRIARVTTSRSPTLSVLRNAALRIAPASMLVSAFQAVTRRDPHQPLR